MAKDGRIREAARLDWLHDAIAESNENTGELFILDFFGQKVIQHPKHGKVLVLRFQVLLAEDDEEIPVQDYTDQIEAHIREAWDQSTSWLGPVGTWTDGAWEFCEFGDGPDGGPEFWVFLDPEPNLR
jgi:hypothetical protein